jgi:hypothetical protein
MYLIANNRHICWTASLFFSQFRQNGWPRHSALAHRHDVNGGWRNVQKKHRAQLPQGALARLRVMHCEGSSRGSISKASASGRPRQSMVASQTLSGNSRTAVQTARLSVTRADCQSMGGLWGFGFRLHRSWHRRLAGFCQLVYSHAKSRRMHRQANTQTGFRKMSRTAQTAQPRLNRKIINRKICDTHSLNPNGVVPCPRNWF